MSYNDITGDRIASRVNNDKFSAGWDAIFKKPEPKITPFFDKEKVELINKAGSEALDAIIERISQPGYFPEIIRHRVYSKCDSPMPVNTNPATEISDSEILNSIGDTQRLILDGFDKKREI